MQFDWVNNPPDRVAIRAHIRNQLRARGLLEFCDDDLELQNHLDRLYAYVALDWQEQVEQVAPLDLAGVAASTTDRALQGIENTTNEGNEFWSSTGSIIKGTSDGLLYQLKQPLARITHVSLTVYRAQYQHGDPLYPPQEVSFLAGPTPLQLLPASPRYPVRLTDQRQTFALAAGAPPAAWLMVRLHGRTQRQWEDGLLYIAMRHVAAHGLPLQPHLVAAIPRALRTHCGLACWPLTSAFAQQHPPQEQPNHTHHHHHQQQAESGDGATPAADTASSSAGGGQGSVAGAAAGGGTARAAAALRRLWGRISGGGGGATGGGVLAAPPAPWALRLQQQWQAEAGQRGEGAAAAPPCGPSCAELQACVAAQGLARALAARPRACLPSGASASTPATEPLARGATPGPGGPSASLPPWSSAAVSAAWQEHHRHEHAWLQDAAAAGQAQQRLAQGRGQAAGGTAGASAGEGAGAGAGQDPSPMEVEPQQPQQQHVGVGAAAGDPPADAAAAGASAQAAAGGESGMCGWEAREASRGGGGEAGQLQQRQQQRQLHPAGAAGSAHNSIAAPAASLSPAHMPSQCAAADDAIAAVQRCGLETSMGEGRRQLLSPAAEVTALQHAARSPACYCPGEPLLLLQLPGGRLANAVAGASAAVRRRRALGHMQGVGAAGPWLVSHYDHEHW